MPSKPSIPTVCAQCSDTFLAIANRAKYGGGKYCSVECRIDARRQLQPQLRAAPNCECQRCGTAFHTKPAYIKTGGGKFCSMECRAAADATPGIIPDDERDLIYMAGLVDGEGTITVISMTNRRTGNEGLSCRLMVPNTCIPLMEWLERTFGGRCSEPRKTRAAHHKPVVVWYLGAGPAVALCERLLPYLKVKRRHAEIILALSLLKPEYQAGRQGRFVPSSTRAARDPLIAELRALNHRGLVLHPTQLSML